MTFVESVNARKFVRRRIHYPRNFSPVGAPNGGNLLGGCLVGKYRSGMTRSARLGRFEWYLLRGGRKMNSCVWRNRTVHAESDQLGRILWVDAELLTRGWDSQGECANKDVGNLVGDDSGSLRGRKRRQIGEVDWTVGEERWIVECWK